MYYFATQGLRTLVIGKKLLTSEVYTAWHERFNAVNTSNDLNKEEKLLALYDELEKDLTYLGSTAIEDLL